MHTLCVYVYMCFQSIPFNIAHMYVCLGLTTWDCIRYRETYPLGKQFPPLSVAFHQGVGHFGDPTGLSLFGSCLGNCNIEISCLPAASPSCLRNAISQQASSCFLFCDFSLSCSCRSCFVNVSTGSWPTIALYLHFVQLWIFGIVMFWKRSFYVMRAESSLHQSKQALGLWEWS